MDVTPLNRKHHDQTAFRRPGAGSMAKTPPSGKAEETSVHPAGKAD
jgi:hypothetical protein